MVNCLIISRETGMSNESSHVTRRTVMVARADTGLSVPSVANEDERRNGTPSGPGLADSQRSDRPPGPAPS